MHLVYIDESGNTGLNLNDQDQPLLALCAMVVDEQNWQSLESDLKSILDEVFPTWKVQDGFEIHATDLRSARGPFAGKSVADRISFRDRWMDLGAKHTVRLLYRAVNKKQYAEWLLKNFGAGVVIHRQIAAFALLSRCVDNYLASLPGPPLGMFISDENKEVVADVEKSIQLFRGSTGVLRLSLIIEKGFFINSTKSHVLQLCDLFALSLRKKEERLRGLSAPTSIDESGIQRAERLLTTNNQHDSDVIKWLTDLGNQRKKEAARG